MRKDEARKMLEDYLTDQSGTDIQLPIYDINIMINESGINNVIEEFSFRYLLSIVYNLEYKK